MRKLSSNISNHASFFNLGGGNFTYINNLKRTRRDWPGEGLPRLSCFTVVTTVSEGKVK